MIGYAVKAIKLPPLIAIHEDQNTIPLYIPYKKQTEGRFHTETC